MKRTLIAAAVLGVASGSVLAAPYNFKDPYIYNSTAVREQIGIEGWVTLFGCVSVSSTAGAVVNNTQNVSSYVTLNPNPQSYTQGAITTHINNSYQSLKGGGGSFASVSTNNSSVQVGATGFQASGGYAYGSQSASVAGGGYQYGQQSSGIGGYFYSQQADQGAHLSAGGHAGGTLTYTTINNPNPYFGGGYDSAHVQGGLSAGYNLSSHSSGSGIGGYFEGTQGSGYGSTYGYQASEGSGWGSVGGQASGYSVSGSSTHSGYSALWGIDSSLAKTDVTVSGTVTSYINTQKPGTLTATTGTGAAQNVSGNVGVNIAEGVNNAQSNDASLAAVDAGNVFGNAQIFNVQSSSGRVGVNNFNLNASVGDNSLQNASGNVGVNIASGVGNAQNNSLAASSTSSSSATPYAMVATDQTQQTASTSFNGSFAGTASLGAGALNGSSGNIGVNIAGGVGNLQHNGLAIAAMSVK